MTTPIPLPGSGANLADVGLALVAFAREDIGGFALAALAVAFPMWLVFGRPLVTLRKGFRDIVRAISSREEQDDD